jgi:uncharacterized membrane protein YfcA
MLESFSVSVAAGATLGYMAVLGIGGGSLLILWLTLVIGMDPSTARSINLMFFVAAAGAVSVFRLRQGTIKIRKILPAIVCGCCSAAVFAWISTGIHIDHLRKLFWILLLFTGIRELFYRPRKAR